MIKHKLAHYVSFWHATNKRCHHRQAVNSRPQYSEGVIGMEIYEFLTVLVLLLALIVAIKS